MFLVTIVQILKEYSGERYEVKYVGNKTYLKNNVLMHYYFVKVH